jgi:hypothetical protein
LSTRDEVFVQKIVAETRGNWLVHFKQLLQAIQVPKVLFWFSTRRPHYKEEYLTLEKLFGEFPQLVNYMMVQQLKGYSDAYVECVSDRGLPHILTNIFTGQPTSIKDEWGGVWTMNWYYPSPEMHIDGAYELEKVCKRYLGDVRKRHLYRSQSIFKKKWFRWI